MWEVKSVGLWEVECMELWLRDYVLHGYGVWSRGKIVSNIKTGEGNVLDEDELYINTVRTAQ
jgi:hypothetical protein